MSTTNRNAEEPFILTLDGLVRRPVDLTYAQLRGLPWAEQVSDFHCVEGWSLYDLRWGGVRFADLFGLVERLPGADYAVFHALGETRHKPQGLDHYVECFPMDQLLDPALEYLLALDFDGLPLPDNHGAPARVVCPYDLAYKAIKYVTRIEFSDTFVEGWWTRANDVYPKQAPVPGNRLRKPDPREAS